MSGFSALQLPNWTQTNQLFNPDANQIRANQAAASNYAPMLASLQVQGGQQKLTDQSTLRGLAAGLAAGDPNALATAATLTAVGGPQSVETLGNLNNQQISGGIALGQAWGGLPKGVSLPSAPWLGGPSVGASGQAGGSVLAGLYAPPATGNQPSSSLSGLAGSAVDNFIDRLGYAESGNNPSVVNKQGYNGEYQFGAPRLQDLGVYQPGPGEMALGGGWNGKTNGTFNIPGFPNVRTQQDFLNSPDAQRAVMHLQAKDLIQTAAATPGAQNFDPIGLMAVGHLGGPQGMVRFIQSGGAYNPHDANMTTLANYYQRFAGSPAALKEAAGHPQGPLPGDHPALQHPAYQIASAQPQTATDATPATVSATPGDVQQLLASYRANQAAPAAPSAPDANGDVTVSGLGDTAVKASPAAAANVGSASLGGPTAQQAVQQATQELGAQLNGMPPDQANALVQQRALQIMQPQQQAPAQPAQATQATPSATAPHPVMPGSNVMSTQPYADQQFAAPVLSSSGPAGDGPPTVPLRPTPPQSTAAPGGVAGPAAPPQLSAPGPGSASNPVLSPAVPQSDPQQAQQSQAWQPSLPPGFQLRTNNLGLPMTAGMPQGYAQAYNPQTGQIMPVRWTPPELKFEKTPTEVIGSDPNTGAIVSRTPITETGRQQIIPTPQGNQIWMNGHPTGQIIPYSGRAEQNEAYKNDQKSINGIVGIAQQAQAIAPRLNEMASLGQQLLTGPTAEIRGNVQKYLETLGVDPAAASRLTGMSSAAAFQEFTKLATSTAGAAAKDDLGSNNGVQALGIYMNANPGIGLVPGANQNITNMMRVINQSKQDYAQAALGNFKGQEAQFLGTNGKGAGTYTPLSTFNQQWLAQNNPHVYAGAMGILNGDPYSSWAAKLGSPAEAMRAAGIAARIDPTISVPIAGGQVKPVSALLGGQGG